MKKVNRIFATITVFSVVLTWILFKKYYISCSDGHFENATLDFYAAITSNVVFAYLIIALIRDIFDWDDFTPH